MKKEIMTVKNISMTRKKMKDVAMVKREEPRRHVIKLSRLMQEP